MIMRIVAISLSGLSLWALWYGYTHLQVFRGTLFWEFRYFIFTLGAFLGLSWIEWALGWVHKRIQNPT